MTVKWYFTRDAFGAASGLARWSSAKCPYAAFPRPRLPVMGQVRRGIDQRGSRLMTVTCSGIAIGIRPKREKT